jgi:hypothetical protein
MNTVKPAAATASSAAANVPTSGGTDAIQLSAIDVQSITQTVTGVGLYSDLRDWNQVAQLLADEVTFDYTSLFGGEVATNSRSDMVGQMRATLQGFDATQHLIGNVQVTVSTAEEVTALSHVRATHWIGERFWIVGGVYSHRLVGAPGGWKVTYMRFQRLYEEGNRAALRDAAARAAHVGDSDA